MPSFSRARSWPLDLVVEVTLDKERQTNILEGSCTWHQHGAGGSCLSLHQKGHCFSGPTTEYVHKPSRGAAYSIISYGGDNLELMAIRLADPDEHAAIRALFEWAREVVPSSFPKQAV